MTMIGKRGTIRLILVLSKLSGKLPRPIEVGELFEKDLLAKFISLYYTEESENGRKRRKFLKY